VKGWIPNISNPIRLSRTPAVPPVAPPAVGADNESILLNDLHVSKHRLKELREAGAFGVDSSTTLETPAGKVTA
jgi:crotonobetainyl-CoA:carnitine CoA-transferase CaiB-like acyl-CoA transferase